MQYNIATTTGLNFPASEEQSVLDAALEQGVVFPYSCKNGQCGVCNIKLIKGVVKERQAQHGLNKEQRADNRFLSCCCSAESDITIEAEDLSALHGIEVKTLPCRINSITQLSDKIAHVVLRLPPTTQFEFLEGQYIDIIGPNAIRRSYSIANCRQSATLELYIKKVEDGVLSEYWFNQAKQNDLLRLEGPKGTFFLRQKQSHLIFLATGTGIAPVIAMLDQLEQSNLAKELTLTLYWGNRKAEEFFWRPQYKNIKLNYVAVASQEGDNWDGEHGYVQQALLTNSPSLDNCELYACGSPQMINAAKKALISAGLQSAHFYSDAFVSS